MFENLTSRLGSIVQNLRGEGRLTEERIDEVLREVRVALLEADVAVAVVRTLTERIRQRALASEVLKSLTPGQSVIRVVRDELLSVLGDANVSLNLQVPPPAVILMAGLQGSGKTTTTAKLGRLLKTGHGKRVMVAGCDVYRAAAQEQLALLARENGLDLFEPRAGMAPEAIAVDALRLARARLVDVLLVDSAGRLHVDDEMMAEVRRLHATLSPTDTLFIVDSMMGQDAVNAATAFNAALPLTGVILTKVDGDARGGAALSVRQVTGKPVLFLGTGEISSDLNPFQPERLVSRILGMGDVLTLIEEVEQRTDREQAERLARKVLKGKGFDLEDFRDQLRQLRELGGMAGVLDKLPGHQAMPGAAAQFDERESRRLEAVVNSMTPGERRRPDIINGSRKRRIAAGAGAQIQDVNRLLKQFKQMQKMMKRVTRKGGMAAMMRGLGGGMPPGFRR